MMQLRAVSVNDTVEIIDVPGNTLEAAWASWLSMLDRSDRCFWRVASIVGYKPYENVVFTGDGISADVFARTIAEMALTPALPIAASTESTERDMCGRNVDGEDS